MDSQFGTSTYVPYAQPQAQSGLGSYATAGAGSQPQTPQQSLTPQASQNSQQQHNHSSRDNSVSHNSSSANNNASSTGHNHPTLPPLQHTQNGFAQFGGISFAHPSSGSQTPSAPPTPSTQPTNGYTHVSPASAMAPPHSAYTPTYPMGQSMMFPSSTATSLNSTATASPGLPNLRPMPPTTIPASLASLPSLTTSHLSQHPPFMQQQQNEEAPTHVVGSQGRRGILPSAPGRPNATTAGAAATSTKTMNLQKDADGKFPCPHCNKTYLHAKHLKRHMLRHTGDRPYSCHLCQDTFSRSDILKRHFQKCSIRRGNPTGLNHLANQRQRNRLSNSQQDGPIGLAGMPDVAGTNSYPSGGLLDHSTPGTGEASTRTSRANSLLTPVSMSHRNSIAGLGIVSPNGAGPDMSHPQSHYAAPNMQGYSMTNGGPMASAYAFSQPAMNNQFYQAMHPQQPLSYLGHNSSRYDQSHSNSPHQQSPVVTDASQPHLEGPRLLTHNGQDGFTNGTLGLNTEPPKDDHERPFNDFGSEHQPALAQAWS